MAKFQCENCCCLTSNTPPRVCKAITLHKYQGVSIGYGKNWNDVIAILPAKQIRNLLGSYLVAFSRSISKESSSIRYDEVNDVTIGDSKVIVHSRGYDERRKFVNLLR